LSHGEKENLPSVGRISKEEVLTLLKGDVSPKHVADMATERKIDFEVTSEVEKELRAAGANDALLGALRDVAPKPAPPASTAPSPVLATLLIEGTAGALVYLDDAPAGTTSPEGKLKLPNVQARRAQDSLVARGLQGRGAGPGADFRRNARDFTEVETDPAVF